MTDTAKLALSVSLLAVLAAAINLDWSDSPRQRTGITTINLPPTCRVVAANVVYCDETTVTP